MTIAQPIKLERTASRRAPRSTISRELAAPVPTSRIDYAIDGLLAILLAFAPFAFGAVEAWSEFVVILLTAAITLCFAVRTLMNRDLGFVKTWAYLPVGLFLLVATLQLVPLPSSLLHILSPGTISLRTQLLSDLPNADSVLKTATLSFYPHGTRHDLRLLVVLAALMVVVANVYRHPGQIKRLLTIIVIIGAVASLIALAQDVTGASNIYWIGPEGRGGRANAGSFVTYSHYSQFMNLSMGAGVGLLLIQLNKHFHGSAPDFHSSFANKRHPNFRGIALLAAFLIVGTLTVFWSGSRGAMVGLLAALCFTSLILTRTQTLGGRVWAALPILLGVCALVLFLGPDSIFTRLSTLQSGESYADRWQILKDLAPAYRRFPLFGTGLGTHEFIYPMFSHLLRSETTTHAENEYAQVLEETGIVGLILVIAFATVLWINYARAIRHSNPPIRLAAVGLGLGLFATMLHSLSDFGQHLPGVACLAAVCAGLLISLARLGQDDSTLRSRTMDLGQTRTPRSSNFPFRLTGSLAMLAAFSWVLVGAWTARAAEVHWKDAQAMEELLSHADWQGTNADMARLISQAAQAAAIDPSNVQSRYSLNAYRWRSMCRVRDEETGEIIFTPQSLAASSRIIQELHQARLLCPTYGPLYTLAGELNSTFSPSMLAGETDLRAAALLFPTNAQVVFRIATLDATQQNWSAADAEFRQYLSAGGAFAEVAQVYTNAHRPDPAYILAKGDPERLTALANALSQNSEDAKRANDIREEAFNALKTSCLATTASPVSLVALAEQLAARKQGAQAVECYRRALASEYNRTDWHLALGHLLADEGQVPEAMREFRKCLSLDPQNPEARKRLGDLSITAAANPKSE